MRTAIVGLILIYGLQITKADDMKVLFLAPPEAKIRTNRQVATGGRIWRGFHIRGVTGKEDFCVRLFVGGSKTTR